MDLQQIKTGNPETITLITDEVISNIAQVKMFEHAKMDAMLYRLHQELLYGAKNKNNSLEMGYFWDLCNLDCVYKIKGNRNGISLSDNTEIYQFVKNAPVCSVVVMHNHPRNGLFSGADLTSFMDFCSIYAMTAVCNDGTIYMMKKMPGFNPLLLMEYYNRGLGKGLYSGMKMVAKNAGKIGIAYRCSVKRRHVK